MGPGPLVFAVLSQGDKCPCFDQVSSVCGTFLCEGPPGILPAHAGRLPAGVGWGVGGKQASFVFNRTTVESMNSGLPQVSRAQRKSAQAVSLLI